MASEKTVAHAKDQTYSTRYPDRPPRLGRPGIGAQSDTRHARVPCVGPVLRRDDGDLVPIRKERIELLARALVLRDGEVLQHEEHMPAAAAHVGLSTLAPTLV